MAFGRLGNPHRLTAKPCQDLTPCVSDRFGALEYPGIRHQSQKCEHTWPWQADWSGAVQLLVEPVSRAFVLSEGAHVGVDKEVGID
jgi:hypothetical protein